jgi:hypothetical protein
MRRLALILAVLLIPCVSGATTFFTSHADDYSNFVKYNYEGTVDIVSDPTSPDSTSNVFRFTFPGGLADGQGIAALFFGAGAQSDLWVQYYFKYSSNFDYGGTGTKQLYMYTTDVPTSNAFFAIRNFGGYVFSVTPQGDLYDNYPPNINNSQFYTVPPGGWHKIRYHIRYNTAGNSDGVFQVWVDDVLVSNYSSVRWDHRYTSWDSGGIYPIWGGGNSPVPSTQYYYVDGFSFGDTDPGGGGIPPQDTDVYPPYASSQFPAISATGVPKSNTTVSFRLQDPGSGVNVNTIGAFIDGSLYTCAVSGCVCTGSPADISVLCTKPSGWSYGQTVTVDIRASDIAGNAMTPAPYNFTVETDPNAAWVLQWSDDFNRPACTSAAKCLPDNVIWDLTHEEGIHSGWSPTSDVWYTSNEILNNWESDGILTLSARKPGGGYNGHTYTAPALITNSPFGPYGKLEVRAKMNSMVNASDSAIWMVGAERRVPATDIWPNYGEIDICEYLPGSGWGVNIINHYFHTEYMTGPEAHTTVTAPYSDFHVYSMEWYADRIDIFVDGVKKLTKPNSGIGTDWPYSRQAFDLILNLEIDPLFGSGGIGNVNDSNFPITWYADYVRFYQLGTAPPAPAGYKGSWFSGGEFVGTIQ